MSAADLVCSGHDHHEECAVIERVEAELAAALALLDGVYVLEGSDMDKRIRAFLAQHATEEEG